MLENINPEKILEQMDRSDFWIFMNCVVMTDEDRKIMSDVKKEHEYMRSRTNTAFEYSMLMEQDPDNWEVYWKEYQNIMEIKSLCR
jgi:hypothetical protein